MSAPRLLDLFCCQGGAGMGYRNAGFEVSGVDIGPQPRYPFKFHQADAIEFFKSHAHEYQAWHASPPCQAHTNAQKLMGNYHHDFLPDVRRMFTEANRYRVTNGYKQVPWVIENVPGAPLEDPFELCGAMFGLGTYRHRLFETNWAIEAPFHFDHTTRTTKMGRKPVEGEMMHVVGNFSGVEKAKQAMGINWMNRDGLRESIPPAYTEFIGRQLMEGILNHQEPAA